MIKSTKSAQGDRKAEYKYMKPKDKPTVVFLKPSSEFIGKQEFELQFPTSKSNVWQNKEMLLNHFSIGYKYSKHLAKFKINTIYQFCKITME